MSIIHNLRLGHACNSSSTHSVIFWPDKYPPANHDKSYEDYGWDNFTLSTPASKRPWIARQVFQLLKYASPATADHELFRLTGMRESELPEIDHQSRWSIEIVGAKDHVAAFIQEVAKIPDYPHFVVLGGNDNSDGHPLHEDQLERFHGFRYGTKMLVRQDPSGFFTIYNPRHGDKIRFSFETGETAPSGFISDGPELVDLKVTDYCNFGCSYCYQNSTKSGKHAKWEKVRDILADLAQLGTFEIALGGGEPTLWPHLVGLLDYADSLGVTVNMTTRNIDWLKSHTNIARRMGAIAISVDSVNEAKSIKSDMPDAYDGPRWNFQYVCGAHPDSMERAIALLNTFYGANVTLLGFKSTGRGVGTGYPFDYAAFAVALRKYWSVRIDTEMARQLQPHISLAKMVTEGFEDNEYPDQRLYETAEGKHSCYIDAVTNRLAVSSYCDPSLYVPLTDVRTSFHAAQRAAGLRQPSAV